MDASINRSVKVLQVTIGDGSYGGIASFLYSYYSHIDRAKVRFDFLYCGRNSIISKADTPVLKDSKVTAFNVLKTNGNGINEYRRFVKELRKYFTKNHYDVVHLDTTNVFLCVCVQYVLHGRSKIIIHSHNGKATVRYGNSIKRFLKGITRYPCKKYMISKGDYYFACSNAAGENLFGKKPLNTKKYRLIKNAIDISKYTFNPSVREEVRETDKFVFGHVGRFTKQKNHEFLIRLYARIHEMIPKSELWLIGEGELYEDIRAQINCLGIEDSVVMWGGSRDDVADLMQGMDMFIFPSWYEGLSIVTIEAQAAGLPLVTSDSISPEHKITDLVYFLPLEKGTDYWANEIKKIKDNLPERRDTSAEVIAAGYEINQAAKELEEFYINLINKKK